MWSPTPKYKIKFRSCGFHRAVRLQKQWCPLFIAYLVFKHITGNACSHFHHHNKRQQDCKLQAQNRSIRSGIWVKGTHWNPAVSGTFTETCRQAPCSTHRDYKAIVLLASATAAHKGYQEEESAHRNDDQRQQGASRGPLGNSLVQEDLGRDPHSDQANCAGLKRGEIRVRGDLLASTSTERNAVGPGRFKSH